MRLVPEGSLSLERLSPPSRPATAYLGGDRRTAPFYRHPPGDHAGAASARGDLSHRSFLADALAATNARLGAEPSTLEAVRRLRDPRALAVVTGQQTAPLTGPLYTVLKAASAVRLAREIQATLGRPVVPVFWAEGDDHDAEEMATVGFGVRDGEPSTLRLEWPPGEVGGPVGDLVPPLPWGELAERVAGFLPEGAFRREALDLAFDGCGDGTTLGTWFSGLLLRLFSPWGLVVVYPRMPEVRALWAGLVPEAVARSSAIAASVREAADRLRDAGFRPQLHKKAEAAPFFLIEGGKRLPVRFAADGWLVGGRRRLTGEMERCLAADPARFSPGVVLRPVFQDWLLPSVAYVGGLAEISYLGQLRGVYDLLGVPMPVVAPRLFGTLLEPGPARVLRKLGVPASSLLTEPWERVFARLAAVRAGGLTDEGRWSRMAGRTRAPLAAYAAKLPPDLDPLRRHLDGVANRAAHLVEEARGKTARELRAREEDTRRRFAAAAASIFPGGLQERAVNVLPFLARHGTDLVRALVEEAPADLARHHVLRLEEGPR